jgi:hypothetical protein
VVSVCSKSLISFLLLLFVGTGEKLFPPPS